MKILFLTDNFPPEVNAPATRTYEHCRDWINRGHEVMVITCVPNFPEGKVFSGYKNKIYQKEIIDGIKVIRVWTYIAANKGFIKRIIDYLSFMFSSFLAGLFVKTDIIVATSPQFFTAISGRWLSFWKRKKWVMEVRDLWPESIKAVGAMKKGFIINFFEFLEKRMYKTAYKIVVVTDSFKESLITKHEIDSSKIKVVKNGINLELFKPQEKNENLLKELGLQNKIIISYIGTHGMAHALDFILKAAKEVKNTEVHFLFIGGGAMKNELILFKKKFNLTNVSMLGIVPKNEIPKYISIADIGLVNLKKSDTFKSVIPSKIFELAAMNKPILLGVEGESKELVEKYKIGISFKPEDQKDFEEKLNSIINKLDSFSFETIKKDYNRLALSKKMLEFLID